MDIISFKRKVKDSKIKNFKSMSIIGFIQFSFPIFFERKIKVNAVLTFPMGTKAYTGVYFVR